MSVIGQSYTFRVSGKTAPTRALKSAMVRPLCAEESGRLAVADLILLAVCRHVSVQTERLCTFDQDNLDERGKPTPEYLKLYEEWGKVRARS